MKYIPLVILLSVLVSCSGENLKICEPIKDWSDEERGEIYMAAHNLPDGSVLIPVFEDYIRMRDESRVCER